MVSAGGGFTVTVIVWGAEVIFPATEESVAWKVAEPLPPVGVPVIAPVLALRLNPGGSEPAVTAHVYGLVPPVRLSVPL